MDVSDLAVRIDTLPQARITMTQTFGPEDITKQWVQSFVIAHNICPFAKAPSLRNAIRYRTSTAQTPQDAITELLHECQLIVDDTGIETTFQIFEEYGRDFEEFLAFFDVAEAIVAQSRFDEIIQIVSFHPAYCFEGASVDDPANATNQSPFPMIHLLRRADVAQAIATHADVASISSRNIEYLRQRQKTD